MHRALVVTCLGWVTCVPSLALTGCGSSSDLPGPSPSGGGAASSGAAGGATHNIGGAAEGGSADGAGSNQGGALETGAAGQVGSGGLAGAGIAGQAGNAGSSSSGGSSGSGGRGGSAGDVGSGGMPSAGAGGASGAYDPCPPKGTPCRLMPMGDSITEGFRATDNRGGYKSRLFHLTLANAKSITFVGSAPLWGPDKVDGVPFPKQNEGIGGRRIDDLINIVPAMSTTAHPNTVSVNTPHLLLLEIGTNNIAEGASSMSNKLGSLLDKIIASDPKLLVVVAKIIPTTTDSKTTTVKAYNDSIPALVKARADAGKHVILADMFTPIASNANYKTALMYDELHPNDAGYTLMAQAWYETIKTHLH